MKNATRTLAVALALAAPAAAPPLVAPLSAQPRASERSTVRQMINGTALVVDFSRPVARGRDNLFGDVVHFGEVWTPGANWATTLEVDRPVRLDGHSVAAGKYSVWLEPRASGAWRLSLHREWRLYHDSPVPEDGFTLRYDVTPREGAHMEALNWYVHALAPRTGTLRMHWGTTYVEVEVETEAFTWPPQPEAERRRYLGAFAFDTRDPTTGGPLALTIEVVDEEGRLAGRWGGMPVALVPAGRPGEFRIGFLRGGALFDVADEMVLRVLTDGAASTGAELLWEGEAFGVGAKVR